MRHLILVSAAFAAVGMMDGKVASAAELIYGFDDTTVSGFTLTYDGSGSGSVSQSTTVATGVTQGTGALDIYVGATGGYVQTDAYTSNIPADLVLPTTTSFNLDLTLNTGTVPYSYIAPVFFIEGASYLGGPNVDKKLLPAASASGENPHLEGNTYAGTTLTYNLQAYTDPFASSDGDSTTALYTPGQITAAVNKVSPSSLAQVTTFGFEEINGGSSGLNYYIDNVTIPSVVATPTISTWALTTGGSWNSAASWSPANIPNAAGAQAILGSALTTSPGVVTLDGAQTVGQLTFNNSSSSYNITAGTGGSLIIDDSTDATPTPSITALSGSHSITAPITLAVGGVTVTASSGTALTLGGAVTDATIGTGTLTVAGGGTVIVATTGSLAVPVVVSGDLMIASDNTSGGVLSQTVPSLTIQNGGIVTLVGPGTSNHANHTILTTTSLSIGASGKLDLTGNDLIVQGGSVSNIFGYIKAGYNLGTFNGSSGIVSSAANANVKHLTALGVATGLTSFDGTAVSSSAVEVKYTYYGDANLDGKVDGSDYSLIDSGYVTGTTGWQNGDFNYDGVINGSDYTLIDNAFNTQGTSLAAEVAAPFAQSTALIAGSPSSVPEPTAMGLMGFAATKLLGRRRRA